MVGFQNTSIFGKAGSLKTGKSDLAGSAGASPPCPQCGSPKGWRDGLRYSPFGDKIQRWLCRDCGLRFSDPRDVEKAWSTFERVERIESKSLKSGDDKVSTRQICVKETKNLATEQKTIEVPRRSEADLKGAIVDFLWHLKKEAYAEDTFASYGPSLEFLVKNGADLFDPENVKEVVARLEKTNIRKYNLIKAYKCFLKYKKIEAKLPSYKVTRKLPFIPLEEEIDQLIAGCGKSMATFLQVLKETGMRCGEAFNLEWEDLDTVARTLAVTPEKGSNPRVLKISPMLLTMLLNLPKTQKRIFAWKAKFYAGKNFRRMRKRIANKLGNPRILKIHFHTLRYWKGTMEYRKFPSLLHVMAILGHKDIKNVMLYVQLAETGGSDDFICEVAKTIQEATRLIEGGFEYVTEMEGVKLFRKRK